MKLTGGVAAKPSSRNRCRMSAPRTALFVLLEPAGLLPLLLLLLLLMLLAAELEPSLLESGALVLALPAVLAVSGVRVSATAGRLLTRPPMLPYATSSLRLLLAPVSFEHEASVTLP